MFFPRMEFQWILENFPNVESFPGLFNYFRDFIPKFALIAKLLNAIKEQDEIISCGMISIAKLSSASKKP